jgi:hypothetical protein
MTVARLTTCFQADRAEADKSTDQVYRGALGMNGVEMEPEHQMDK